MRRYNFLTEASVYEALNKLRSAFLAAKDSTDVDEIITGILTHDERMRIGRRIIVAQMISSGISIRDIAENLNVGLTTINNVHKKIDQNPSCFELINNREEKVEAEYRKKAFKKTGGSKLVYKKSRYTGFKRKNVKR